MSVLSERMTGDIVGSAEVVLTESQLPTHSHDYSVGSSTDSTGEAETLSLIGPSLAMNYLIAVTGNFPTQSRSGGERSDSSRSIGDAAIVGSIAVQSSADIPSGWVPADGRLLDIATNNSLFSLLGTTYGGDGESNFRLPDLRGRAAVHSKSEDSLNLGDSIGEESIVLHVDQLPPHAHAVGGISISQSDGTTAILENGTSDSFTVSLSNRPNDDVVLTLSVADPEHASIDLETLTFTSADWSTGRTVTVSSTADGDRDTQITISVDAENSDSGFDGVANLVVPVIITPRDCRQPKDLDGRAPDRNRLRR